MLIEKDSIINNRYTIYRTLGQGGMGIVFRGHDRLTKQKVAIKLLNVSPGHLKFASKSGDSNPKLALINEFRILAGLRHPNIISVYDYGLHDGVPFIVMEYKSGTISIDNAFQQAEDSQKVQMLLQVLEALAYLHRRHVIHRDLKPSNILVSDTTVKVLDFGLSVAEDAASGRAGTLAYMSPETLDKGMTLPQSDLYSVGVLAYEAFAGHSPYSGNPVMSILYDVPDMTPIQDYPIVDIVERLLLKDPADRYQTASDVITAIEQAYDLPHRETVSVRESFLQASAFVGRDDEINLLMAALEQAKDKQGSAWLVGGESGVGKSRLFDEFRIRALTEGAFVLRGLAVDGGGLPFQLWRDITRRLLLSTPVSDFEASVLGELVPDIEDLIGRPVADAPYLQGEGQKMRLIATIVDLLKRQTQPTVLLLEDLQWTEESLDVVRKLQYFIGKLPLLIVGNYRNDERADLPDELPGTQVIQLERLSELAISELIEAMLGEQGKNPNLLSFLQQQTEGNAFFMVEVMRALAEDAGQLSDIGRQTLPDEVFTGGIETIIQKRLETVPVKYHNLLYLAAIAGRYLDIDIMKHLASESDTKLDDMLLACSSAHVLDVIDDNWRFVHDKIRDGSLRSIPQHQMVEFHKTVAIAIESVYPDNEDYAATLIDMWRKAETPAKEFHYLLVEGDRLYRQAGLKNSLEAVRHYSRARNLLMIVDHSAQDELAISLGLGIALLGSHQIEKAAPVLEEAIELATKIDNKPELSRAMVGLARTKMNSLPRDEIIDLMNKAVDIAYDGGDMKVVAASRSVEGYIYAHYNDLDNALKSFLAARDALTVDFVDYEVAQIINNIGKITQIQGNLEDARNHLEESRELALKSGHYNNAILSTSNLGTVAFFSEDYQVASDYFAESIKLMQQSGDIAGESHVWILKSFADAECAGRDVVCDDIRAAITARTAGTRDYSNMYIVMGGIRLLLMLDNPMQAASWSGLADKLGGENPFVREWLDPLQEKVKNAITDPSKLEDLLAYGAELEAEAVVNEIGKLLIEQGK